MFKNLRDRLNKVQNQLEDELEAKLEAELDAELEAQLAAELETAAPEPAPEVPEPAAPAPVEPAVPEVSEVTDAPAEPEVPEPVEPSPPEPVAEPEEETVEESDEVSEPAEPEPAAPEPVPTPDPTPAVAPAEVVPEPAAAPAKEVITGRKQLSEQEIEARLARELTEAVEVQKEVETVVGQGLTKYTINEDVLEDILWELELGLLESDVALPVIEAIKANVQEQLLSMSVGGRSPGEVVEKVLRSAIKRVLSGQTLDFDAFIAERIANGQTPIVVMFVGVNGTGKTTSIARIAHRLKEQGITPVLAAGDTFRAGAIAQLSQHADVLGVKCIKHSDGADPAAVAYDAIEHAKARNKPVVLLDTAGRMQTNTNLMDEMDKIRRVAKPHLTLFVGDSLAGNDAVEQARRFDEVVDIDGAILTKVDVDAKGGAALSVAYTINKPLVFVGVGQGYADLQPFDAGWLVDRLFGDES